MQNGGWSVCEVRPAGNPSSHFMLRGTLLFRSGAKPFKFINMFKLLQGFFTDADLTLPPTPIYCNRSTILLFSSITIQMGHTVQAR